MDEAGATRKAAFDSVSDVGPDGLSERIDQWLEQGSTVPGVLTIYCARLTTDQQVDHTDGNLTDPLADRAAGVQLIYEGLRLTRELSHEEPWANGKGDVADLDILVADVLVARGFHLLARTGAAEKAVETVRAFGRDQTTGRETGDGTLDGNLEADVLELAVIAGSDFGTGELSGRSRDFVDEKIAQSRDLGTSFPPAERFFPVSESGLLQVLNPEHGSGDGLRQSVDD